MYVVLVQTALAYDKDNKCGLQRRPVMQKVHIRWRCTLNRGEQRRRLKPSAFTDPTETDKAP
jgi:hypothetical protein